MLRPIRVAFPATVPSPVNANVSQTVRASVTVKNTGQAQAVVWVQVTGTGIVLPEPAKAQIVGITYQVV